MPGLVKTSESNGACVTWAGGSTVAKGKVHITTVQIVLDPFSARDWLILVCWSLIGSGQASGILCLSVGDNTGVGEGGGGICLLFFCFVLVF